MVKADAYGTGLIEAGAALAGAGCDTFFVAVPSEGIALRRACPTAAIYILNGLAMGQGGLYLAHALRPVLGSQEEILEWRAVCREAGTKAKAALHVDTGMNRLGLSMQDFAALISGAGKMRLGIPLALLMSHFVTSDNAEHPLNARQMRDFREARALVPRSRQASPIPRGYSSAPPRITISSVPATRSSAATRRRDARTRCEAS